jgi:hypothetical protein
MAVFVIDGRSLTPRSTSHKMNVSILLDEKPSWFDRPIKVGPHQLEHSGQIDREKLLKLLEEFDILRKNKKFFDNSSIALFHCVAPLRAGLLEQKGEDIGLYVNLGPANADLEEFSSWARENSADNNETFSSMMASSVVKILPNVVMSNIAMNASILGENTVSAGTSVSSAWALNSVCRVLEEDKAKVAIMAAASFPYQYFNIDAYLRFFGEKFFHPPLCEASAAVSLSKKVDKSQKALGTITGIHLFKAAPVLSPVKVLEEKGFNLECYDKVLLQPSASGNYLAAAEPLGLLTVLESLASIESPAVSQSQTVPGSFGAPCEARLLKGLSVTRDYFGNYSVIEVSNEKN